MSRIEAADSELVRPTATQEMMESLKEWMREKGLFWATSATAHFLILSVAMLVLGAMYVAPKIEGTHPEFEDAEVTQDPEIENFDIAETPLDPTELNTETLTMAPPNVEAQINTTPDEEFIEAGGGASVANSASLPGMSLDAKSLSAGVKLTGGGGIGGQVSSGTGVGSGDKGTGFGGRGQGVRNAVLSANGGTKASERAVAAALLWLSRHQSPDGSWSLGDFIAKCKDGSCATGVGKIKTNPAATAMALLPFLAAGQTHLTKGPYQSHIKNGLYWLVANQKGNGDLSDGAGQPQMYTHGLCTICLCEAYGLSRDKYYGAAAQKAIYFIEQSQHPAGGWRYKPREEGDTSVVGWQVMALKSAHMAGLAVNSQTLDGAKKFLTACGNGSGQFGYLPAGGMSPPMSAVGLLCTQYLGASKDDPVIKGGSVFLTGNMPNPGARNVYYWYYATQVMHNLPGPEWDAWNRAMRKILIDSQTKTGCALGSWDPKGDQWGNEAGRVFQTSLSCLTLEVYYRYLPLYKLDEPAKKAAAAVAAPK